MALGHGSGKAPELGTAHGHSARVCNYWLGGEDNFAAVVQYSRPRGRGWRPRGSRAMGAAQFAAGLGVPQSSPVFAVGQAADATGYTQTAAGVQPTRTVLLATLPHKSPSAAPESHRPRLPKVRSAAPESHLVRGS